VQKAGRAKVGVPVLLELKLERVRIQIVVGQQRAGQKQANLVHRFARKAGRAKTGVIVQTVREAEIVLTQIIVER
jgi:hypothetical protein